MCTEIYIGPSVDKDLSLTDENTGFWVARVIEDDHFSKIALETRVTYEVGSYMGCSCGLAFREELENESKRKANCSALKKFLENNFSVITGIVTFYDFIHSNMKDFPHHLLNIESLEGSEFDFKDDVIYSLKR